MEESNGFPLTLIETQIPASKGFIKPGGTKKKALDLRCMVEIPG